MNGCGRSDINGEGGAVWVLQNGSLFRTLYPSEHTEAARFRSLELSAQSKMTAQQ
jgi:hypothetical protein